MDGLTALNLDIAAFTTGVAECPDSFTFFRADSPPGGDPLRKKKAQTHPWAAKKQGARSEAETPRRTNQSRWLAILVAFDTTAISDAMLLGHNATSMMGDLPLNLADASLLWVACP